MADPARHLATSEQTLDERFGPDGEPPLPDPGTLTDRDARRWRVVTETFQSPARPVLNRIVLWANLLIFGYGAFLALQQKVLWEFLMPIQVRRGPNGLRPAVVQNPAVFRILENTGMLRPKHIIQGDWWRLLACCFVHFGLLHLAMNLYALRFVGCDVEWLWGPVRYLIIYFLSALGGSCAAMMFTSGNVPPALAGASGALCGLFAAEAVWLVLNRRFLPKQLVSAQMRGLFFTGIIIVLISLAPGVSGASHFGGAVIGAVVAVLLHLQRFGAGLTRIVTALGLLAIPAGCLYALQQNVERDPRWKPLLIAEERRSFAELRRATIDAENAMRDFAEDELAPLLEKHHKRREEAEVRRALAELPKHRDRFQRVIEERQRAEPFEDGKLEEKRQAALDYFRLRTRLMERVGHVLEKGLPWDADDKRLAERTAVAQKRWYSLVRRNRADE